MKASELAAALGGKLQDSDDIELTGMSTLNSAGPTDVSFVADRKYMKQAADSHAGVLLVPDTPDAISRPRIVVSDVWSGVLSTLKLFHPDFERKHYSGVHPTAIIDPGASIAADVTIGPNAVIGADTTIGTASYISPGVVIGPRCRIGENVTIYANAVIEADTVIGNGVYIQAGAVIAADGFKYEPINGRWTRIPQVGHVELGDGAEVGANSCIDRASYDITSIGDNTKIDNLVQIAHNATIGENCVVVAQTGVAGSTTVGKNSILAAQAGIADNLTLGEGVVVMAQGGVIKDIPAGQMQWGTPAMPFKDRGRIIAASKKLPALLSDFNKLQKRVAELEKLLAENKD